MTRIGIHPAAAAHGQGNFCRIREVKTSPAGRRCPTLQNYANLTERGTRELGQLRERSRFFVQFAQFADIPALFETATTMNNTMKELLIIGLAGVVLLGGIAAASAQPAGRGGQRGPWYQQQPPVLPRNSSWMYDRSGFPPTYTAGAKTLPLISVKGNKFVDPDGKTVLFRGLCISDPDKIAIEGHWGKEHFVKVKEMGTMLVRIPVHPISWRERGTAEYLKLLDQAVGWCTELGMYVMLDWHSIGNLGLERLQDPMYQTTKWETYNFWDIMARHYAGHNTVAFYELFNEPAIDKPGAGQRFGTYPWEDWKKICEEEIGIIRARIRRPSRWWRDSTGPTI